MDPQVPVRTAHNCLRSDSLNFLRQYTDIGLVGTVVGKPIEPKAVVETTEKNNVMLERDIGPASATTPTAASASTSSKSTASESGRSESASASAHARTERVSLGVAYRRASSRLRPMGCGSRSAGLPCPASLL